MPRLWLCLRSVTAVDDNDHELPSDWRASPEVLAKQAKKQLRNNISAWNFGIRRKGEPSVSFSFSFIFLNISIFQNKYSVLDCVHSVRNLRRFEWLAAGTGVVGGYGYDLAPAERKMLPAAERPGVSGPAATLRLRTWWGCSP
jgi:hypothetical protein